MRRRHQLSFLLVAVVLLGATAPGAPASEESRPPEGFERERVYFVPVEAAGGRGFGVERVVVNIGDRLVGVSGQAGIVRQSQDRIRLRGVPVVGKLFMDRLTSSDFAAEKKVGNVFAEDRALFVDLSRGRRGLWFETVVVVHREFSYRFQGELSRAATGPRGEPTPVGTAYADGDTLLVLIRPTIITDSVL